MNIHLLSWVPSCELYPIQPQQHSKYGLVQDAVHWVFNVCSRHLASSRLHSNKLELPSPYSAGVKTKEHQLRGVVNQDGFIEDQRNTT